MAEAAFDFYELTCCEVKKKIQKSDERPLTSTMVGRIFGVKPELVTLRAVGSDVIIFPLDDGRFELTGVQYEVDKQMDTSSGVVESRAGPSGLQPIRALPRLPQGEVPVQVVAPPAPAAKKEDKVRLIVTLGEWSRTGKIVQTKNKPECYLLLKDSEANLEHILKLVRDYFGDPSLSLYTGRHAIVPDDRSSQGIEMWKERTKNKARHFAAPVQATSSDSDSSDSGDDRRSTRKRMKRVSQKIKHMGKAYKPNCTICFEVLRTDEPSQSCTECGHMFHQDCLSAWLNANPDRCAHCGTDDVQFFQVRLD